MPTPQGIQTVTLHGRFVEPDLLGTPLVGSVTFTPNVPMVTFPNENTLMSGVETAPLDNNGEFTIDLPCTDTPDQNPDGWTYTVTERLIGVRGRTYQIALPFTLAVVELADITPTEAAPTWLPVTGPMGPGGLVQSVNGISLPNIVLTAADLDAVDVDQLGVANGVATLDALGKLTSTQAPDLSGTYVLNSRIGAASGVAGLSTSSKVPSGQLDLATSAPGAIATTGAAGVITRLAREDHTHAGVALTGDQTVAGVKTFTGNLVFSGEPIFTGGPDFTTAAPSFIGATSSTAAIRVSVAGEGTGRMHMDASGSMAWGNGTDARDVTLYRSGIGLLNVSGQLIVDTAAPSAAGHVTRKDYVDGLDSGNVKLTTTQTISGEKTFSNLMRNTRATSGDSAFETRVVGDAAARWFLRSSGEVWWGPGTSVADVRLYRSTTNTLKTDSNFEVGGTLAVTGNLSAANMNLGAGVNYVPVWNGTIGSGILRGRYTVIGKLCIATLEMVAAANTVFTSSTWTFSLPFTSAAAPSGASANWVQCGSARAHASNWYTGVACVLAGTDVVRIFSHEESPATEWKNDVPFVWAASATNYLHATIMFEIA